MHMHECSDGDTFFHPVFTARCCVQRVIAMGSRLSICLSVCDVGRLWLYIGLGWNSPKIISRLVSLGYSLSADPKHHGSTPKGTSRNVWRDRARKWHSAYKSSNISETQQDRTKVTIEEQQEVTYALSIGAKIDDLGWPWRVVIHSSLHSVSKHAPFKFKLKLKLKI